LLADPRPETHLALSEALVDSVELAELVERAERLAAVLTPVPGEAPDEISESLVAG
jgi:hypothetical protein